MQEDLAIRKRARWGLLVLLFVLALVVRAYKAREQEVVPSDTIRYIELAQGLVTHPVNAMRNEVYHPLHSLFGAAAHAVIGRFYPDERMGWIAAMKTVGVFFGAVVALEIFAIARMFGAPFWPAMGAAFIWIVGRRTSAYGADGISDMLFLALFGAAMLLAMKAMRFRTAQIRPGQTGLFFVSGVVAGLAYLARPEGLAAPLIVTLTVVGMVIAHRPVQGGDRRFKIWPCRRVSVWAGLSGIGMMLIGAAMMAAPYMVVIGKITGKKSLGSAWLMSGAETAGFGFLGAVPIEHGLLATMGMELWETFGFASCLALLLALPLRQRMWGRPRLRLLVIQWVVLWFIVMVWLFDKANYLDGRHTLPLQLALYGLLALALVVWTKPMRWWMNWWQSRWPDQWAKLPAWRRWGGWPAVFGTGVFVLISLPGIIMLVPERAERPIILQAVDWVKAHVRDRVELCDSERLVGYFAGMRYEYWGGKPGDWAEGYLASLAQRDGTPLLLTYTFRPGNGEMPVLEVDGYRAVASFASRTALHHDVLVIYAKPGDDVFKAPPGPVPTTIPWIDTP